MPVPSGTCFFLEELVYRVLLPVGTQDFVHQHPFIALNDNGSLRCPSLGSCEGLKPPFISEGVNLSTRERGKFVTLRIPGWTLQWRGERTCMTQGVFWGSQNRHWIEGSGYLGQGNCQHFKLDNLAFWCYV